MSVLYDFIKVAKRAVEKGTISYSKWRRRVWATNQAKKNLIDKNILSIAQTKEIKDYFRPYFDINTVFHKFYTEKTGKFDIRYMPDDFYYAEIDHYYNDPIKAQYLDDKSLYDRILEPAIRIGFKLPENVITKSNGYWIKDGRIYSESEAIAVIKESGELFLKQSVDSEGGHGVKHYDPTKHSDSELREKIIKLGKNFVAQRAIKQSPTMSRLNASSVNTIRLLSLMKKNGEVKIYSSVVRMGIGGSKVDNASSGGITCGIESDGKLKPIAYSTKGEKYNYHPDTKLNFDEIIIPGFESISEKIKEFHPYLPWFRLLSWDVAIDEDNSPILIEVNMTFGELDFHQLNNGPVFGDDTEEILREIINDSKK